MNFTIEYEDDYYEEADNEYAPSRNQPLVKKKKSLEDWIKEKKLNSSINDEIQFSG